MNNDGKWEAAIDDVATKRGYKNRDTITVTKEGLGDAYEAKLQTFFEVRWIHEFSDQGRAHLDVGAYARGRRNSVGGNMHPTISISHMSPDRFILSGSGFFDVRGVSIFQTICW